MTYTATYAAGPPRPLRPGLLGLLEAPDRQRLDGLSLGSTCSLLLSRETETW